MFVDFSSLDLSSRVWIFQSETEINKNLEDLIKKELTEFLENWVSHGRDIISSFEIKYETFIVIAVSDSINISGCSIDTLINFVKSLENKYNLSLMNKNIIKFKNGSTISSMNISDFKSKCEKINNNEELIVFNNLVNTIADYRNKWEIDIRLSWHKRYL